MNKRKTGNEGEKKAISFLENEGCEILETNYSCKIGEIDIIAKKNNTVIFIEVKYRKNIRLGMPYESVNYHKQKKIIKSAFLYAQKKRIIENPMRFDVIEIIDDEIHWFENAFEVQGNSRLL